MALDHIEFTDRFGRPLSKNMRDELVESVISAIAHPKADVDAVIRRARAVARKAGDGEIRDLKRYATKALFATAQKERLKQEREPTIPQPPHRMEILAGTACEGSMEAIEARILVEQLLSKLSDLERNICLRYVQGWDHREIAKALGISEATSWIRLARAKKKLARYIAGES